MRDFIYHAPTKVYFGRDKHKDVGAIIKEYGFTSIMMQYGKSSIKKSGLYDEVMASLKSAGIKVVEMGGVEPNPNITFVRNAIKVARENNVEMILAVGGGSVIDSCKYTAAGVNYDGDVWDFPTRKATVENGLPIGCILTLAAAGSEMSSSAVITNSELNMKRGFNSEYNRCLFAICNPELTYSVSKYQTACGIVDIMAHTMERYFIPCEPTELTDRIAESILKSVINAGRVLMNDPCNYEARATMMWASSLSHNDLTGCGRENALPVHQLEHAVSGKFDSVAHGAGLAVLLPAWMKYVKGVKPSRFAQFARGVFDVTESDDSLAADLGIKALEEFFDEIGMPLKLSEFGIKKDDCHDLADLCTYRGKRTISGIVELGYNELKEIFELAL
jgi:alcohol dehydrogenase YqhD (iron-dependent ADH family)